jgi:hypothetical protein
MPTKLLPAALPLLLAAAAVLGLQQAARAQDTHYALVRVYNDTSETITYTFQWGTHPPHKVTLQPGRGCSHSWRYDSPNKNSSPPPTVSYDNWIGAFTQERVRARAVTDKHQDGKLYSFQFDGNRLVLFNLN